MEIIQLEFFVTLARVRNFTKAAEEIGNITQPGLSKQIQKLEREVRTTLFTRDPKGTSLTKAGERFLRHANRILRDVKDATEQTGGRKPGHLRIGYAPSHREPAVAAVDGMLRRFKKSNNKDMDVHIQLHELSSSRIETWITDGRLDLGLVDRKSEATGFEHEQLGDAPLRLIVHKDWPELKGRKRIEAVSELARANVVLPSPTLRSRKVVDTFLDQHKVRVNVAVEANSVATMLALVRSIDTFVAILPVPAPQRDDLRGLPLLHLPGEVPGLETFLLWRESLEDEPPLTTEAHTYRLALREHLGRKKSTVTRG